MSRTARLATALAAVALLLTGCTGDALAPSGPSESTPESGPPPFADCAALDTSLSAKGAGKRLPDMELPCFTGGQKVHTGQIRGPALLNFWASWCPPCREELPAFQRLADRARGRVHVVGVVNQDDRGAAQSLARELGITFPALFDREGALLARVARSALPVTVFVDAEGRIVHTYQSKPLDDAALARLTNQYLGVRV